MRTSWIAIFFAILFIRSNARKSYITEGVKYFTNAWLVKLSGGLETAKMIAEKENLEIIEKFEDFPGLFHFEHKKHPKKIKFPNIAFTEKLYQYKEVIWTQQTAATTSRVRKCSCPEVLPMEELSCPPNPPVNEELYDDMYYMHDCRQRANLPVIDLNVVQVWNILEIYGRNIIVMIIDDGVETKHEDLRENYIDKISYDIVDKRNDPNPVHSISSYFNHGTKCAGIIASKGDNKLCGVGIAPLARWAAIRLHGFTDATDVMQGAALLYRVQYIHVSNNSWGPQDDGKTMEYLTKFQTTAIKEGIIKGRRGRGVLYVFAAGNGKRDGDMCGYDGLVNSIHTIVVAGVDNHGKATFYSERCSAIMVTSYSTKIVSTDVNGQCTQTFQGTSAAAPIVSGVLALVLEMNPELNWRDVQHILAWTANPSPLQNNPGWRKNKAGFWLSHDFGFGLVDAFAAVKMAEHFQSVPPMSICVIPVNLKNHENRKFTRISAIIIEVRTNACFGLPTEINYIEHVEVTITVEYPRRGDLQIDLISPQGTITHLVEPRKWDKFPQGLLDWSIDSVHTWGESPRGRWKIVVYNKNGYSTKEGEVVDLTLAIYGTKDMPAHYKTPRSYYTFHPQQSTKETEDIPYDESAIINPRTSTKKNKHSSTENTSDKRIKRQKTH